MSVYFFFGINFALTTKILHIYFIFDLDTLMKVKYIKNLSIATIQNKIIVDNQHILRKLERVKVHSYGIPMVRGGDIYAPFSANAPITRMVY